MSRRRPPMCRCGCRGSDHLSGRRHPHRGERCLACDQCPEGFFFAPPPPPPPPQPRKPPKCGKQIHRSRLDALIALARVRARDNPRRPKLERRAYFCDPCGGFHLTARA